MSGRERIAATLIIWSVVLISIIMITIGEAYNLSGTVMFLMVAIAAAVSTEKIWESKSSDKPEHAEKSKRHSNDDQRVDLLLRLMDDYEKQALKERLLDDLNTDGEMVSLDELLKANHKH